MYIALAIRPPTWLKAIKSDESDPDLAPKTQSLPGLWDRGGSGIWGWSYKH